ncbi:MAG TPA: tRNA (adenosine(37)-N6)-threonylcarbamoyltransferase complex ATPase subunit type 1 TsaE [Candidatus Paceibacterota bacterium]
MEKLIPSLDALAAEAGEFVRGLRPCTDEATLVTLSGELGAGKTAFTKAAARALGIDETVTSPTFVLEKIYALPEGGAFERLIHIDAYRLESGAELAPLGFDDLMRAPGNLILLEWPEKVADTLPEPYKRILLVPMQDGSRILTYA